MTTERPRVLVVDDRVNMVTLMQKVLRSEADVVGAVGGQEALDALERSAFDVVLCDYKMPDVDGLDVLKATKRLHPGAEFILMTAYATVGNAVEAMRLGAFDYLTKPFDPDAAKAVVQAALGRAAADPSRRASRPPSDTQEVLEGVVAGSEAMVELADMVRRVAPSAATVMVLGETGTGKERIARAIHELSDRSSSKFVAVNCAAIPEALLESELFGHVKGAFTGAVRDRQGLFEEARGGTLFLDEIGDMRLSLQAKLTRVLEERRIRRVGESKERDVDVRLVAATHHDLERMVGEGTFRQDLWYRLNVATLRVPPLRHREGDVMMLAQHFLREANARNGLRLRGFTPEAELALSAYPWPGNVRQLRAAVERSAIMARDEWVSAKDLPEELTQGRSINTPGGLEEMSWNEAQEATKDAFAAAYLRALMRKHKGKVAAACAQAEVERESFYRLLRRYGVELSEFR